MVAMAVMEVVAVLSSADTRVASDGSRTTTSGYGIRMEGGRHSFSTNTRIRIGSGSRSYICGDRVGRFGSNIRSGGGIEDQ